MSDTILAHGHGISFSDGTSRCEYRILADGTIETGYGSYPPTGSAWIAPTSWTALKDAKSVAKFANSTMSEGQWWRSLSAEVKDVVRSHYGMSAPKATFACRGAKDGCGAKVMRQGAYCPSCEHDA